MQNTFTQMKSESRSSSKLGRTRGFVSSMALTAALLTSVGAWAQGAPASADSQADQSTADTAAATGTENSEIVVTASRVARSGFEAPTPTTVLGLETIERLGVPNVADAINRIPGFLPSLTPATSGASTVGVGANILNLRGTGAARTLILVNGRRHVATTSGGLVDVNLIPQGLVERVEVVTGGASAAWGSDAVAGVVNFILDDNLQGFKGSAQVGISDEGDNREFRGTLAYGTEIGGGRGHLTVSGEIYDGNGIKDQADRDWGRGEWQVIGNPAFAPGNGQPRALIASGVRQANRSRGGLIVSGPLAGTEFGPGGVPEPFQRGTVDASGRFMIGGDGPNQASSLSLVSPLERQTLAFIGDYDVTDSIKAVFEGSFANVHSVNEVVEPFSFTPYTIQQDNAFLPASIRAQLAPGSSFQLGRVNSDFGYITADTTVKTYRAVFGLEGDLGSGWTWSSYYQYGKGRYEGYLLNNVNVANLNRALDAVRNPANGQIVCRSTLADPTNGCVPLNPFGEGSPSAAALAYIHGRSELFRTNRQDVVAAQIQGEPFSTWAGPVSLALGAEYRDESTKVTVDPLSQSSGYLLGNAKAIKGDYDVKEAFGEVVVPLLKDQPFAETLEFNGAVRFTDYSTSDTVTTWKAGLTYQPFSALRFRAARSRDIRAPNLDELYAATSVGFGSIQDPQNNGAITPIQLRAGGNLDLKPEKADTTTLGVVIEPEFIPGFRASVDYYNIDIERAISRLSPQSIVNRCFQGATDLCQYITRDASGRVTEIFSTSFNIASLKTEGVDFEISYNTKLDSLVSGWEGGLSARLLGTWVDRLVFSDGINAVDRAGDVGPNNGGVPDWRLSGSLTYDRGPVAITLNGRYIAAGKYDNTLVEGVDINDNSIPSRFYLDTNVEFTVVDNGQQKLQLFGVVNNLFDKDPPIAPQTDQSSFATNFSLYDTVGRSFVAGVRFQY